MWNLKQKQKQNNIKKNTNKQNKLIDTENRMVVAARGGGGVWEKWVKGVNGKQKRKNIKIYIHF